jgi:hypothetical protein
MERQVVDSTGEECGLWTVKGRGRKKEEVRERGAQSLLRIRATLELLLYNSTRIPFLDKGLKESSFKLTT